jgi:hypothetical protein
MTKNHGSLYCHQQNRKQAKQTELQPEIECPRYYDTMTLNSDFDGLYYYCEQCDFRLYTQRK